MTVAPSLSPGLRAIPGTPWTTSSTHSPRKRPTNRDRKSVV